MGAIALVDHRDRVLGVVVLQLDARIGVGGVLPVLGRDHMRLGLGVGLRVEDLGSKPSSSASATVGSKSSLSSG